MPVERWRRVETRSSLAIAEDGAVNAVQHFFDNRPCGAVIHVDLWYTHEMDEIFVKGLALHLTWLIKYWRIDYSVLGEPAWPVDRRCARSS